MTPVQVDATDRGVAALLPVVADPMRWRILTLLAGEQLCTTHLQDVLGAKQALVSHHLKVLRDAGLLDTEPCGRFTYYRLRPGALDALSQVVAAMAEASARDVRRKPC